MKIIPAIDIQNGKVVRLFKGDFTKQTIYSKNPIEVAQMFVKKGAKKLHIVNLDGARTGRDSIIQKFQSLVKKVNVPIQYGGGIRDIITINQLIEIGVSNVILGTMALEDSNMLKKVLRMYGDKIIVSLDAKRDKLMKKGWQDSSDDNLFVTAQYLERIGVSTIIYTDTEKDGTLTQPNYKNIEKLRKSIRVKLLIAGGVSSSGQIKKLERIGVDGVIIGKALYEGVFPTSEVAGWTPRR